MHVGDNGLDKLLNSQINTLVVILVIQLMEEGIVQYLWVDFLLDFAM